MMLTHPYHNRHPRGSDCPGMQGALSAKARDWHAESRRTRSRSRAGEIGAAVMLLMGFATSWGTVSAIILQCEAPVRLGSIRQKGEVERIISAFSASSRAKLPFPAPHSVALGPRCREDDDGVKMWWTFLARNCPEDVDWLALYVICLAIGDWNLALQDRSRENTRGCFRRISGPRRIMLVRQRPTEARRAKQP
jgi:hypothetical protein